MCKEKHGVLSINKQIEQPTSIVLAVTWVREKKAPSIGNSRDLTAENNYQESQRMFWAPLATSLQARQPDLELNTGDYW